MSKLLLLALLSFSAFANFNFEDLSKSELETMSNEIAANFSHTTVTPGTAEGKIFGFQVGVVAGATTSEELERLSKEQDPDSELDKIPTAGLMAALSIPFGITAEATLLPSLDSDNAELTNRSFALKYNIINLLVFDLAIRAHYSSGEMSYSDAVNSVSSKISIEHSTMGAHLIATAALPLIKPYVGVGVISQETTWNINTSAPLFDFTSNQSVTAKGSSTHILAGVQVSLLVMNIGVEYAKLLYTERVAAKLSFGF
jgi:hypothetical protein